MSRICIIGAGIGGLALARSLSLCGFKDVEIFERDVARSSRPQGYSISLRSDMGVVAMQKLSLEAEVQILYSKRDSNLRFCNGDLSAMLTLRSSFGSPFFAPRLQRSELRDLLLKSVENFVPVHWNRRCVSVKEEGDVVEVEFENGKKSQCDLLIGADGVRSVIRQCLFDDQIKYCGLTSFNCRLENPSIDLLEKLKIDEETSLMAMLRSGACAFIMLNSNVLVVSLSLHVSEDFEPHGSSLKDFLLSHPAVSGVPVLEEAIKLCKNEIETRKYRDRDPIEQSPTMSRVVVLGDAAHPMLPFQGLGANSALLDAVLMADCLKENETNIKEAAQKFSEKVRENGNSAVKRTRWFTDLCHTQSSFKGQLRNAVFRTFGLYFK